MFRSPILLLAILALTFTACIDDEQPIDPNGEDRQAFGIRHDRQLSDYEAAAATTATDRPDFGSVVSFSYSLDGSDNHDVIATGTLVKPDWILTAGHNFFVSDEQSNPAPVSGIEVFLGTDMENPTRRVAVAELVFHPTWLTNDDAFATANDLCLVRLAEPINDLPLATLQTDDDEELGSTVWFAGYGDYSQVEGNDPNRLPRRHAVENVLDRKTDGVTTTADGVTYTGGVLAFDFDDPDGSANTLGDDRVEGDEALVGTGTSQPSARNLEGSTVQGDSGGPLFVNDNGTWRLAGVLSGGLSDVLPDHADGDYGDVSVFIRVSTQMDWISSVVE